ncbi:UTP-hexose-1-phosphate uridylyltransferase [Psychrobacillus sp. OK028]|uniref:UDP-glucose--hexose-1-phosphate uridylyltransferase n=1 Tax=Psychrobacillus sp. OK028 TaxID=1884359 RepID=UPI00088AA270|nr:UDP-glucose--hexose-1-phosphate uridylyltransferase [Psychrobacillus sp. OK028]SDN13242.1 UTP-hexose-1-phosphate uridylyltransferase [Psychrobacillus sp. OK028]
MIYEHIQGLIQKAIETKLIYPSDRIYVFNQILSLLDIESSSEKTEQITEDSIPNLLEKITTFALDNNVIEDNFDDKEILSANIMNCFVARPSTINEIFQQKYKNSPKDATDYFYELSKNSNYIQMNRIKKNIHYKAETIYGNMDITINMSKPEKDPEQIKRERDFKHNSDYPKCVLCIENEGYAGRLGYPARANHRIIKIQLGDENWYLQYSPYVYYNEHSILLAEEHRDMKISKGTFERLLAFIEKFPHYFIGSNADLPIVGGSILNHDHYQAGRYEFPMTNAPKAFSFTLKNFSNVTSSILDWPLTTLRLQSEEKASLVQAADHILSTWKNYSDKKAKIIAFTGNTPHNTITPIARMRDGKFELDLVLRNNRTTDEHPLGIFHPHSDVHHIKKENIGLIEVMGLAVLPARLKNELDEIKQFLLGKHSNVATYHLEWADQLKEKYGELSHLELIESAVEKELGDKFAKVLGDAGVFKKQTEFERFIKSLNRDGQLDENRDA